MNPVQGWVWIIVVPVFLPIVVLWLMSLFDDKLDNPQKRRRHLTFPGDMDEPAAPPDPT